MTAKLYLAPTTDAVLSHIVGATRTYRRERPLAPLTFLLPSGDAVRQLRGALGDTIAVRLLQFYSLSAMALSQSGSGTREMGDLATRRLARGLLRRMGERGELTTFAGMVDKPGFIDVAVEWLREMKTQGIAPEAVAAHAEGGTNARDRQLAGLYMRYQAALREADCADADGLLWLAAESLERDRGLLTDAGEIVIAGFDQFSPVQMRMVAALAGRAPVTVYLLWDEARTDGSLALARLAPTRQTLQERLAPEEASIPGVEGCGAALGRVRRALFERDKGRHPDAESCIRAVAAASPEGEVRFALRRVKQLLLDGALEEQIALLAPHPGAYRAIVAAVSREYGVPVALETTLGENPCVAALLNVLRLAPAFPWRETFDALRSPYLRQAWLDATQVALLDRLTRERPVIAGREQWRYALEKATQEDGDAAVEDEDRGEPPLIDLLDRETVDGLKAGLETFFDHLTPPQGASAAETVAWIQEALLGVDAEAEEETPRGASLCVAEAAAEGEWAERDLRGLRALLGALREWLDATALARELRLDADGAAGTEERWRELLEWLPGVPVPPDPRPAAVRFGPLEMGRAVTVDHLFVLGLGEGEFPRPPQADPLYTAAERAAHPLPLVRTDSGEDASLWWHVLCNCQCSLTLLRPRYDPSGAEWLPSAYWDAVVGLVEGLADRVEKPKVSPRPTVGDAACASELLEALARDGARGAPDEIAAAWRTAMAAQIVSAARDGWDAPSGHEGALKEQALLEEMQRRYGRGRSWSVSRLNRYGICPYAFWAQYALKLEADADPDEGMDAQQRGSLAHKILEVLFAAMAREGLAPSGETAERIARLLEEACDELLPGAAERYGFRPGPLWEREQRELRNELRAYMAWECEAAQAGGFKPFRQELKFGLGDGYPAVVVKGLEGEAISLHGVIDRIDRDDEGRLRVIDYKTGNKTFNDKDIAGGRALQSALYAWAVEMLMPNMGEVAETAYRHTGKRKQSGVIKPYTDEGGRLIRQAAATAVRFAGAAADGWFAPLPSKGGSGGKACGETCDFHGLCRVTRHGVRKAQRHGPQLLGSGAGERSEQAHGGEA